MLVLDMGGTYIKYALTDEHSRIIPGSAAQAPTDAEGSYEDFLRTLSGIISVAREKQNFTKACACIAGPFDFEGGISLMKHKFTAVYGKSLRPPFEQAGVEINFLHDSTAFILGEAFDGVLKGMDSPCCIMLGTGLGFAFMRGGKVCVNEKRTPAFTLWNMPWLGGIAEDFVSTRAIQGQYGEKLPIKVIADLARQGDTKALQAFKTVGERLSEILKDVVPRLGCDYLALGGQIAKSAELFHLDLPVPWRVSEHMDDAALRGVSYYAHNGQAACERVPD